MGATAVGGKCSDLACDGSAISSLDQQDFCLNHFLERCYQGLAAVDPRGEQYRNEAASPAAMRAFIEECSRRALDVSLGCDGLSNLERGRLLDILLWAGELFLLLRAPRSNLTSPPASDELPAGTRAASTRR